MKTSRLMTMAIGCALAAGAGGAPAHAAGAAGSAAAYGKHCLNQSADRSGGATTTPRAACAAAMARLARAQSRSPQLACAKLSHRRAAGAKTSPFAKCVTAGRRLVKHGNGADLAYVEEMIPHHVMGVEMARLALTRTQQPFIRSLAESIVVSQSAEITRMRAIVTRLRAAGIRPASLGLTAAQMGMDHDTDHLVTAEPFDVAFVDHMIPHHEGAITMSGVVRRRGVGAAVRLLAEQITDVQRNEIRRMNDFRAFVTGLPGGGEQAHAHDGLEPHPH